MNCLEVILFNSEVDTVALSFEMKWKERNALIAAEIVKDRDRLSERRGREKRILESSTLFQLKGKKDTIAIDGIFQYHTIHMREEERGPEGNMIGELS